jgi:hypothetical protein
MNINQILSNFLQQSIPNQTDFENFFTILNQDVIGQVLSFDKSTDFTLNENEYLLIDSTTRNIYSYPLLFKSSFLKNNHLSDNTKFYEFDLSSLAQQGSFIFAGQQAEFADQRGTILNVPPLLNFTKSFSFMFDLSTIPISGIFCFQSKNKNFEVSRTGVQLVSSTDLYDKASTYKFLLTGQNTFYINTYFQGSSSFTTSTALLSTPSEFYNYEPVMIFDFSNFTDFKSISASLQPVFKTINPPTFPVTPTTASFQLTTISGYDAPAGVNPLSTFINDLTASYTWQYAPYFIIPDKKRMVVFMDTFYPYEGDTFLKMSFITYNTSYTNLSAISTFPFSDYVDSYESQTNYVSAYFSSPSASNTFLLSSLWSNSFYNDFIVSLGPPLSNIGPWFFGA